MKKPIAELSLSVREYSPEPQAELVMLWLNGGEEGALECVPRHFARWIVSAQVALIGIANGDGCDCDQAWEYKNIARAVLGMPRVGGEAWPRDGAQTFM